MSYTIQQLSDELVFIQWQAIADKAAAHRWVEDIRRILDNADKPQYFFSDLCQGYVNDSAALIKHGELTKHPHYGGGITFGNHAAAVIYVKMADRLAKGPNDIFNVYTIEAAVTELETLKPGLTAGIDLKAAVEG